MLPSIALNSLMVELIDDIEDIWLTDFKTFKKITFGYDIYQDEMAGESIN